MKYLARLLSVILTLSMMLAVAPAVSYAASSLPKKIEFNTNGAFTTGTDGITFNSGTMTVSNGMLQMTEKGTEKVHESAEGTQLYYEITPVMSGTLVFETDYIATIPTSKNCIFGIYDSAGTEVARVNYSKKNKFDGYVNGDSTVRMTNPLWDSADNNYGFKFEIDLDNKCYHLYQAKTKNDDGTWKWGEELRYTNVDADAFTGFEFMNDVSNVSKIRVGLYQQNAGIDNFKVYKKVTTTQTATSYNMLEGETQQAGITFSPAADKPSDLIWASSNESVATVDANGLITAKGKGSADITVKSAFYDSINYTYKKN